MIINKASEGYGKREAPASGEARKMLQNARNGDDAPCTRRIRRAGGARGWSSELERAGGWRCEFGSAKTARGRWRVGPFLWVVCPPCGGGRPVRGCAVDNDHDGRPVAGDPDKAVTVTPMAYPRPWDTQSRDAAAQRCDAACVGKHCCGSVAVCESLGAGIQGHLARWCCIIKTSRHILGIKERPGRCKRGSSDCTSLCPWHGKPWAETTHSMLVATPASGGWDIQPLEVKLRCGQPLEVRREYRQNL